MADTTAEVVIAQEHTPKQRIDSKLILQNMEEVLHTVKKKHREKHRRKKEQKQLSLLEESQAASSGQAMAAAMAAATETTTNNAKSLEKSKSHKKNHHKTAREEDKEKRSKKMQKHKVNVLDEVIALDEKEQAKNDNKDKGVCTTPMNSITNAFEIMMNARNRSFGSNTSGGKEMTTSPPLMNECNKSPPLKYKNKMKLQEFAEKVCAGKRHLDEEARDSYINRTLKQRAKRFKKMLMNGGSTPVDNLKTSLNESNQMNATVVSLCLEDEDEELIKEAASLDMETQEFLAKLNSPTKKADTLLGYFPKVQSIEMDSQEETSKNGESTLKMQRQKRKLKDVSKVENVTEQKEQETAETPVRKRRGRPPKTVEKMPQNAIEINKDNDIITITTTTTTTTTTTIITTSVDKPITNRPRRSCVGKARYDYDLEVSPTELAIKSHSNNKAENTPTKLEQSNELLIDLDESSTISSISLPSPKKLAPIFARSSGRSIPKPISDPEIAKARKAFLTSGVPEKLRIEQEKQKLYEQHYEDSLELFPKITHVRQLSKKDLIREALPVKVSYKFRDLEQIPITDTSFRNGNDKAKATIATIPAKRSSLLRNLTDCIIKDTQMKLHHKRTKYKTSRSKTKATIQIPLPSLLNKREIIKHWKSEFGRFPTYKCYNQMREKYRHFNDMHSTQNIEQVSESFMVTRGNRRSLKTEQQKSKNTTGDNVVDDDDENDDYKPPITAPNGELLFTEKYKPLLYEQVLVNLNPVIQLKQFLSNWSTSTTTTTPSSSSSSFQSQLKRNSKNEYMHDISSDNNSNSNSNSNLSQFANAIVLMGPIASGKTTSVFALANDMNFNVLEINAGMKRTGKRLIQELQEATQSHQIRKEASASSYGLFNCKQKQLVELSVNGRKAKAKVKSNSKGRTKANLSKLQSTIDVEEFVVNTDGMDQMEESLSNDLSLTSRKCLILIEDADIVFDQMDAGFIDAIYSLAASSKRPVILVASNPNCHHLQKLLMQNNSIEFYVPTVLNIVKFLAILSLIENCPIHMDDLISLYLYNRKDLRKTLLELQFFIQSGGDRQQQRQQPPDKVTSIYYASPRKKRQFSIEQFEMQTNATDGSDASSQPNDIDRKPQLSFYTHRGLLDFYTINQNVKCRVPYPIDFELLSINVNDLIQMAMHDDASTASADNELNMNPLKSTRKSRSPKKQWLTNAAQMRNKQNLTLKHLTSFYENLSIAEYINRNKNKKNFHLPYGNDNDRLMHSPNDEITHYLVEQAIDINLNVESNSYNLYVTTPESFSLCKEFPVSCMNARHLDYEPCLRAICRSERLRCNRERRSTRFYHYLRNYVSNLSDLSMESLDQACHIFQETSTMLGDT